MAKTWTKSERTGSIAKKRRLNRRKVRRVLEKKKRVEIKLKKKDSKAKKTQRPSVKRKILQKKVSVVMNEFKERKLRSGGNKKIVSNPKQAIAISLAEARKKTEK